MKTLKLDMTQTTNFQQEVEVPDEIADELILLTSHHPEDMFPHKQEFLSDFLSGTFCREGVNPESVTEKVHLNSVEPIGGQI